MINDIPKDKTDLIKNALDENIGLTFKEKRLVISRLLSEILEETSREHVKYVISHYRLDQLGFRDNPFRKSSICQIKNM